MQTVSVDWEKSLVNTIAGARSIIWSNTVYAPATKISANFVAVLAPEAVFRRWNFEVASLRWRIFRGTLDVKPTALIRSRSFDEYNVRC